MSGVETASSLFDSSDNSSDLFTTVVDVTNDETLSTTNPLTTTTGNSSHELETSTLFSSSEVETEVSALFPAPSQTGGSSLDIYNAWTSNPPTFSSTSNSHPYSAAPQGHSDLHSSSNQESAYQAEGWDGKHEQWQNNEHSQGISTEPHTADGYQYTYGHSAPLDVQIPYANDAVPVRSSDKEGSPVSYNHSSYSPSASVNYQSSSTISDTASQHSQAVYDPYKPSTHSSQRTGTTTEAVAVSPYDQNAAVATSSLPQDAGMPPAPYPASGSSVLSRPPKPSASQYRPTSYNAYDPPLPAKKPPRSAALGLSPPHIQHEVAYRSLSPQTGRQVTNTVHSGSYFPTVREEIIQGHNIAATPPQGRGARADQSPAHGPVQQYVTNAYPDHIDNIWHNSRSPQTSLQYQGREGTYGQAAGIPPMANSQQIGTHKSNESVDQQWSEAGYSGQHPRELSEQPHASPNVNFQHSRYSYEHSSHTEDRYSSNTHAHTLTTGYSAVLQDPYPNMSPTTGPHSPRTSEPPVKYPNGSPPYESQMTSSKWRTRSPGNESIRSWTSSHGRGADEFTDNKDRHHGLSLTSSGSAGRPYDYNESRQPLANPERMTSPSKDFLRSSIGSPGHSASSSHQSYNTDAKSGSPPAFAHTDSPAGSFIHPQKQSPVTSRVPSPNDPRRVAPISSVLMEGSATDKHKLPPFQNIITPQRTMSPSSIIQASQFEPYADPVLSNQRSKFSNNPHTNYHPSNALERSASDASTFSTTSSVPYDPYAPTHAAKQANEAPSVYGAGYPLASDPRSHMTHYRQPSYESSAPVQDLLISSVPAHTAYAPSPSLLGTNDPLGRAKAKVPLIAFGFGGKLVTCFHSPPMMDTGFDVALSSRQSRDVQIRVLHKILPESTLDISPTSYPGPLFGDPGTPVSGIVRSGTSHQVKTKKAKVVKYLEERADEISRGLGYLTSESLDRRQAEGKLVIVRLLNAMVKHDGQISGSPQVDIDVRAAILPRLAAASSDMAGPSSSMGFAVAHSVSENNITSYPNVGMPSATDSSNMVYNVPPSSLDTLQELLLKGERRQAYHYALDEKMWAHAMVISSSIDKEAFKEVVNEFIKAELGVKDNLRHGQFLTTRTEDTGAPRVNGRESLRVAYSLFSGQSAASVQELLPPNFLHRNSEVHSATPGVNHFTPMSPNFPTPALVANLPSDVLSKWQETAVMILSGQMGLESSAALTTLGDYLAINYWTEAAHVCYLLSPQSSLIGGIGTPSSRVVLVGSQSPQKSPAFHKDSDSVIFTEIAEFALSLRPPVKGQEPFCGLPHLQAYRLIRAEALAELGYISLAKRYCEAITSSTSRGSPYFTPALGEQLKELSNRLIGNPELDKTGSWIGGRIAKPSLDSIGDWLGGRLSRFVAGEGESTPPLAEEESASSNNKHYAGTFSHYSTISSTSTSTTPSPAPSIINEYTLPASQPRRSGSATGLRPLSNQQVQIDRASSAMDHLRPSARRSSPVPRVASASAATTTFSQTPSFAQVLDDYKPTKSVENDVGRRTDIGKADWHTSQYANGDTEAENPTLDQAASPWWGSSQDDESTGTTPTATTFFKVNAPSSPSGFISLMDDYNPVHSSVPPSASMSSKSTAIDADDDDDDDLGLGNSTAPKKSTEVNTDESTEGKKAATQQSDQAPPKKPELKTASTGSWLGRLWGRGNSASPGPIKASLGEETSFVYDPELKRWVNKKAGAEASKSSTPPPPPSRAQTTSPTRASHSGSNSPGSGLPPPPARPASAIDLSSSPPRKTVMRMRSNLVPNESESAPSSPTTLIAPPPPGRPKSSATKRNIRNRYVDILQEQPSSS